MSDEPKVKEKVCDRYGEIAAQFVEKGEAASCCPPQQASCCAPLARQPYYSLVSTQTERAAKGRPAPQSPKTCSHRRRASTA